MEEFMLWYTQLIRRLHKPALNKTASNLVVSKSKHWWIKYRLCSWILVMESVNIMYSFIHLIAGDNADSLSIITCGVWTICAVNILSVMYCFHGKRQTVSQIFRKWDAILTEYQEILADSPITFRVRNRKENLKTQFILGIYLYSIVVTAIGVTSHFINYPKTAIYLYNRFEFDSKDKMVRYYFMPHEFGWMLMGVFIQFGPEVFVLLLARRIHLLLNALETVPLAEGIKHYKNLDTTLRLVNDTFKWWVQRLEYVLVFYVSLIIFTAIRQLSHLPFLAAAMFIANGIAGVFRNFMMLTPMGAVNSKSVDLLKTFAAMEGNALLRKQLKPMRPLEFKNGGFHFIDSCSSLNFITFVISQVIFLLQTF